MSISLRSGASFVFFGDSITDCNHASAADGLGHGYVGLFADLLAVRLPNLDVKITNCGISGNTVRDLAERFETDVLPLKPDWLCIQVGINDLHTLLRRDRLRMVGPDDFSRIYAELLQRVHTELPACTVLLIEPFYIMTYDLATAAQLGVFELLYAYRRAVHALAEEHSLRLVRMHEQFAHLIRYRHPQTYCPEPVHPNRTGHLAIAEAVYAAC